METKSVSSKEGNLKKPKAIPETRNATEEDVALANEFIRLGNEAVNEEDIQNVYVGHIYTFLPKLVRFEEALQNEINRIDKILEDIDKKQSDIAEKALSMMGMYANWE